MDNKLKLDEVNIFVSYLETVFISFFTYYLALKIINSKESNKNKIIIMILFIIIAAICKTIKQNTNSLYSIMCLSIILSLIFSRLQKKDITYSILVIAFSLSINYIILFLAGTVSFFPNYIMKTQNDYIGFIWLTTFYILFIYGFTRIKRFKKRIYIYKK